MNINIQIVDPSNKGCPLKDMWRYDGDDLNIWIVKREDHRIDLLASIATMIEAMKNYPQKTYEETLG